MALVRLIVVLLVTGSLGLLFWQNRSPELALNFLGLQTQALPLAAWILVAITLGILTSLILTSLLWLSGFFASRRWRSQVRELEAELNRNPFQASSRPRQAPYSSSADSSWVDEVDTPEPPKREPPNYEVKQEPKSRSQAGSVYSYSFRDQEDVRAEVPPRTTPKASVSNRSDGTVDAEYRVIIPPRPEASAPPPPAATEDDWEFTDDEDWNFEDEPRSDRRMSDRW